MRNVFHTMTIHQKEQLDKLEILCQWDYFTCTDNKLNLNIVIAIKPNAQM